MSDDPRLRLRVSQAAALASLLSGALGVRLLIDARDPGLHVGGRDLRRPTPGNIDSRLRHPAAWDPDGLVGVFTAPFLHGGFGHLMANSLPLLVLGFVAGAARASASSWPRAC